MVDARLSGNVYKKRIALRGRGKRGSCRAIVAGNAHRWFFMIGFAKNERVNVSTRELRALCLLAKELLDLDDVAIAIAVDAGELVEIYDDQED